MKKSFSIKTFVQDNLVPLIFIVIGIIGII